MILKDALCQYGPINSTITVSEQELLVIKKALEPTEENMKLLSKIEQAIFSLPFDNYDRLRLFKMSYRYGDEYAVAYSPKNALQVMNEYTGMELGPKEIEEIPIDQVEYKGELIPWDEYTKRKNCNRPFLFGELTKQDLEV